jgi:PKD repeat protein
VALGDMTSGSTMNPPVHTYSEPGTCLVVLSVSDAAGMTSESALLEIRVHKAGSRKQR